MQKPHHHVGHLHAGVVDVILHFHVRPVARSMRTKVSPRIALRRWPMCAALLGLMLVCSTMIFAGMRGKFLLRALQQPRAVIAAVEPHVQISVARRSQSPPRLR